MIAAMKYIPTLAKPASQPSLSAQLAAYGCIPLCRKSLIAIVYRRRYQSYQVWDGIISLVGAPFFCCFLHRPSNALARSAGKSRQRAAAWAFREMTFSDLPRTVWWCQYLCPLCLAMAPTLCGRAMRVKPAAGFECSALMTAWVLLREALPYRWPSFVCVQVTKCLSASETSGSALLSLSMETQVFLAFHVEQLLAVCSDLRECLHTVCGDRKYH